MVAALLRIARVTADLAKSNGSLPHYRRNQLDNNTDVSVYEYDAVIMTIAIPRVQPVYLVKWLPTPKPNQLIRL